MASTLDVNRSTTNRHRLGTIWQSLCLERPEAGAARANRRGIAHERSHSSCTRERSESKGDWAWARPWELCTRKSYRTMMHGRFARKVDWWELRRWKITGLQLPQGPKPSLQCVPINKAGERKRACNWFFAARRRRWNPAVPPLFLHQLTPPLIQPLLFLL